MTTLDIPPLSLLKDNNVFLVEATVPAPNSMFYYSLTLGAYSAKELAVAEVNKVCNAGNPLYRTFSIKRMKVDTSGPCVIVASYDRVKWRIFDVTE